MWCGVVCVVWCGKTDYTAKLKVFRVKVLSVAESWNAEITVSGVVLNCTISGMFKLAVGLYLVILER